MTDTCQAEGCSRPKAPGRKGYCIGCYQRLRRRGTTERVERVVTPKGECSVEGCGDEAYSLKSGLCKFHYQRQRSGVPLDAPNLRPRKVPGAVCRMDDCTNPVYIVSEQLCNTHYLRLRRKGDPAAPVKIIFGDDEARFWSYVDKDGPVPAHRPELGPCWAWTGGTNAPRHSPQHAYGRIKMGIRMVYAHRWMLGQTLGEPLKDSEEACHHCDNTKCVRPDHLFVGTHRENMDDRDAKGRGEGSVHLGADNGYAKLTDEQVDEIRRRYRRYSRGPNSGPSLAAEFGVTKSAISRVVLAKTWKHVA